MYVGQQFIFSAPFLTDLALFSAHTVGSFYLYSLLKIEIVPQSRSHLCETLCLYIHYASSYESIVHISFSSALECGETTEFDDRMALW